MNKQEMTQRLTLLGWRRDKWGKFQKLILNHKQAGWHRIGLFKTGCDVYVRQRDETGTPCWIPIVRVCFYDKIEVLPGNSLRLGEYIVKG